MLWVAVWFFYVYFFSYNSDNREYVIWFASFLLPLTLVLTYYVVYSLIPKYLLERKFGQLALYTFYSLVFSSYLLVLIIIGSYVFLSGFNIQAVPPMAKNVVSVLILVYMIVGMVSFVSILNYNFQTISKNKELQNKILSTQLRLKEQELYYLKKQIHPHFLFNTLNTIYGMSMAQSKHTPDIILKLSNLLDYILYQVEKPAVSLKEEVLHIKEYIDLEKIRFQDTLRVRFTSGDFDENIQIAPMLLIPFIENAFKHGSIINGFLEIIVNIELAENRLDFCIRNTAIDHEKDNEPGGIGLANIRKRLDLHYNNNYQLHIETDNKWHEVKLTIFNLNVFCTLSNTK
jgi:sensor histidine kinase YesM